MKRKYKAPVPFTSERLVMITNDRFNEIWPTLKTNLTDLEAVRRRVDMYWKYTRGLKPFSGFNMIKFRFQDVDNPLNEQINWLGIFYPINESANVSIEDCLNTCLKDGLFEMHFKTIIKWCSVTFKRPWSTDQRGEDVDFEH